MTNGTHDRALEALHRLLADGNQGGQAKVDALLALAQRTVWVGIWGAGQEGFRTLTNSEGNTALPVFTTEAELASAAGRLGWTAPDGSIPGREVGAREALRHAIAHDLHYVVVDFGSDHALDIEQAEIEPMLTPEARRESQMGPYAGVGRVSSSMTTAVKPTPRPDALPAATPAPLPGTQPAASPEAPRISAITAQATEMRVDATFGSGSSVTIRGLAHEPSDDLLDGLSEVLRGYPEVEWACIGLVARGPAPAVPAVGLRLGASFRQRVNEIITAIRRTAEERGASLDVLLLDDPQVVRTARQLALVFYPWRK